MTYTWSTFNLEEALSGTLVGFQQRNDYDLSCTGVLQHNTPGYYEVKFGGYTLRVGDDGVVIKVTPANSSWLSQTLQMVTADMGNTGAVGGAITRSSGSSGAGHNNVAILTNIEPRDQFAVQVLNAMLIHAEHPEAFDDAKCLMYSRAAYRWAQAMMIAAADSREGQADPSQSQPSVTVNSGDLQSNTEKLLYNISQSMKNGVALKGEVVAAGGTPTPIQTKVTEIPDITIDDMPEVEVKNALDTNDDPIPISTTAVITELPTVEVKNPLDTNDDPIPLEVNQQST